jgi:uncharacterized membrane protein YfcA
MEIYLPIAELSVNVPLLLAIGVAVGVVAGLFGVGGGFLSTPLLILVGIPPAVAIATVSAQIAASSASGIIGHAERRTIDWSLATALVISGTVGSALGVAALRLLESRGLADTVVTVAFLLLLGGIGSSMSIESLHAKLRGKRQAHDNAGAAARPYQPLPYQSWVFSVRTPRDVLRQLAFAGLGCAVGFLGALIGIGGGLLVVPVLIYAMRVPTAVAIGTSSVMLAASMLVSTTLHAATGRTVDAVLALILIVGGVAGAQFGSMLAISMRPERLRLLLGLLILAISGRFALNLIETPADLHVVQIIAESRL